MGLSSKLVGLGAQYFQTSEADTCPICEATVSRNTVRASLEKRLKDQEEGKAIEGLRARISKWGEQTRILREAEQSLDSLMAKLEGFSRELNDSKKKLIALGLDASHVTDEQQLESFIKLQEQASGEQESKLGEEIREAETRKIELESIERRLSAFLDVEKKLQQLTGSSSKGQELLTRIESRKKELGENARRIAELGQKATAIREAIALMKSMIGFLTKKDEVEKMEKIMLPGIVKRVEALEPKLKKMQDLGTAIDDIHRAAISTQEDFMGATLGALQKDINKSYFRLVPHPHFGKLELVPEEHRGKFVYRILAQSKDGKDQTYVQTRFSLAQMNIAAIALFLAIARRVPLGFLVFDDPSQSLDLAHKKGLADALSEIGAEQQILVATQDEELQQELKRTKRKTKAQIVELESWTTRGTKAK
jgi:DNA repair exonuclease SbcCD ATPase subunit